MAGNPNTPIRGGILTAADNRPLADRVLRPGEWADCENIEELSAVLWLAGFDTHRIARFLRTTEACIYNALHSVRERARA